MAAVSITIGVAALVMSLASLLPVLGWLVWISIPLAVIGFIFAVFGLGTGFARKTLITGLLLNMSAAIIGFLRLA